jgi:outer membrane receptor protein involved in Fe transport
LLLLACVCATSVHADESKVFNIQSQSLAKALLDFSAQSNVAIMAPGPLLEGKQAPAVSGSMPPLRALEQLLRGTGLTSRVNEQGAVVISAEAKTGAHVRDAVSAQLQIAQAESTVKPERETKSSDDATSATGAIGTPADSPRDRMAMPEILVTGSRVLNMDIARSRDDSQPYVIFDRATIERSGATNLGDFLRQRLPMNSISGSPSQAGGGNGNQSMIALRGLSPNETLILIDGHRAVNPSVQGVPAQSDINGISMAAVERIEILPTTASGIYGGGATGGVINIIMRRDYTGVETRMTYENSFASDTAQRKIDVSAGFTLEDGKTSVLLAGSYSDANPFLMDERDYMRNGRLRVFANNPGLFLNSATPPLGYTTNIRSAATNPDGTPRNLTLDDGTPLNSPIVNVPVGYAGLAAAGDGGHAFLTEAGQYNFDLARTRQGVSAPANGSGAGRALVADPEVKTFSATIRRPLTDHISAFLDLGASNNDGLYASNQVQGVYSIAANAPNNPFAQPIRVTVPLSFGDTYSIHTNSQRRAMGGLIFQLPGAWTAETDYTWDRSRSYFRNAFSATSALATAINSGAIDVLRDLNDHPVDMAAFLNPASLPTPYYATFQDAVVRLSGPVLQLPGGPVMLSTMIEHSTLDIDEARQTSSAGVTTVFPGRMQAVNSAYLEARLPLIGPANAKPGVRELELQLAGRWDEYTIDAVTGSYTAGSNTRLYRGEKQLSSVNPTIGLRYVPAPSWILRASFGTGFLPPDVNQLAPIVIPGLSVSVLDPRRGNAAASPSIDGGVGNPNLDPEESRSWSAGVVFSPLQLPALRMSLDYTRISKSNAITFLPQQQLVDNEALFPERVVRAAPAPGDPYGVGPITYLDLSRMNIARTRLEAWDFSVDYRLTTASLGTFDFYALGTRQPHFETQLLPGQPYVENVGITAGYPSKLKGNVGVDWSNGRWLAGWTARYIDSYLVSTNAGVRLSQGGDGRVDSQLFNDVYAGYRTGGLGLQWLSNIEVRLGVRNVFDEAPAFDAGNSSNLYYSFYGDPRGATYYLSLKSNF